MVQGTIRAAWKTGDINIEGEFLVAKIEQHIVLIIAEQVNPSPIATSLWWEHQLCEFPAIDDNAVVVIVGTVISAVGGTGRNIGATLATPGVGGEAGGNAAISTMQPTPS